MPKKPLKIYSLEERKDEYIGKIGMPERDQYEHELRMKLVRRIIKNSKRQIGVNQEEFDDSNKIASNE